MMQRIDVLEHSEEERKQECSGHDCSGKFLSQKNPSDYEQPNINCIYGGGHTESEEVVRTSSHTGHPCNYHVIRKRKACHSTSAHRISKNELYQICYSFHCFTHRISSFQ